ncbi:formin-binding protein [Pleurotus ostreatus]|nr:formin-binding protein [Pleurotus ostreatus]
MARRQPSVTSLSRYATGKSPNTDLFNGNKSRDFCNAFWGQGDAGVNVLLARMRGAARTMDELRNFWKQRSLIEEEYATRLASLAKTTLGKDEIGEMRAALDTLRAETDNQAGYHLALAHQIRNEIEVQVAAFSTKQSLHKSTFQVPIEKRFKSKITHEAYVNKSREKFESDVARINAFTQSLNAQRADPATSPRDVDKLQARLTRAQQTVQANEKDYAGFVRALSEILPRWEQEWKDHCDRCQDLEEERLDFMRENIWAYANAVSTLCVSDDQSCEKIRVALDAFEVEKDIENFVQEYGTGSVPQDAPGQSNGVNGTSPVSHQPFERVSHRAKGNPEPSDPLPAAPVFTPPNVPAVTASPPSKYPPQQPPPQSSPPPLPPQPPAPAPTTTTAIQQPSQSRSTPDLGFDRINAPNGRNGVDLNDSRSDAQSVRTQGSIGRERERDRDREVEREREAERDRERERERDRESPTMRRGPTGMLSEAPRSVVDREVDRERENGSTRRPAGALSAVEPPRSNLPPPSEPSPLYEASPSLAAADVPILFYVKALYDYQATTPEEFDFQTGDVIAVTATPEDGWWIGELLDENRREPRRNVFPSNFVCLF